MHCIERETHQLRVLPNYYGSLCDLFSHGGGALVCFSMLAFILVFVHLDINDGYLNGWDVI